jgi:Domain of unknown function (DUF4407)
MALRGSSTDGDGSVASLQQWGLNHTPSGWLERKLWAGAGASAELLEHCPQSDRIKYQGLGGIVWATGLLAFISGSFAFYTIVSPKTDTSLHDARVDVTSLLIALLAGAVWAAVIFNLDRFIVSSTGKGDGTERITWMEFFTSLPRLVMATVIGVCIATPLELHILKPEIDAELGLQQQEQAAKLNAAAEKLAGDRKAELAAVIARNEDALAESDKYFEERRVEIVQQQKAIQAEAEGLSASGKAGCGPACLEKKDALARLSDEREIDMKKAEVQNARKREEVAQAKEELKTLEQSLKAERKLHEAHAAHMDGLLARIHISHEIGGLVPYFITGLLLMIELAPIFFKMMLTKGTYDYLVEYEKRRRLALLGVELEGVTYHGDQAEKVVADRFLRTDRMLEEERLRLEDQHVLSKVLHDTFRDQLSSEIRERPDSYIEQLREGRREA